MRHPESVQSIRSRASFTLVELLVVIAIISVLAAMLLPALGRARAVAQANVCQNNQRSTYQALAMYTSNFDDRLPPSSGDWGRRTATKPNTMADAYLYYIAYYGVGIGMGPDEYSTNHDFTGLWACPTSSMTSVRYQGGSSGISSNTGRLARSGGSWVQIYMNNDWARFTEGGTSKTTFASAEHPEFDPDTKTIQTNRISRLSNPSSAVAFADGFYYWVKSDYPHFTIPRHHSSVNFTYGQIGLRTVEDMWDARQLNGAANLTFGDGHVGMLRVAEIEEGLVNGSVVYRSFNP